ncbi:hypothetical protein PVK06_030310 [Gossypium arboreum]|uniref:Uncharacterized protein n=1 Tax=Gossypium arboreum TaxID=29729 RepID=A0ABR0NN50_GOSAR|nr:hypothetical protein PVK06_030310 [Gossypium arboreum]
MARASIVKGKGKGKGKGLDVGSKGRPQSGGENKESMARASIVKGKGKGKGKGLDVGSRLKDDESGNPGKIIVEIRLAMEEIVKTIDLAIV